MNGAEWMNNFFFERVKSSENDTDFGNCKRFIFWHRLKNGSRSLFLTRLVCRLYVAQNGTVYALCKTQKRITQIQTDEVHCDTIMKTWIWMACESEMRACRVKWKHIYKIRKHTVGNQRELSLPVNFPCYCLRVGIVFVVVALSPRPHQICRVRFQLFVTFIGFVYSVFPSSSHLS